MSKHGDAATGYSQPVACPWLYKKNTDSSQMISRRLPCSLASSATQIFLGNSRLSLIFHQLRLLPCLNCLTGGCAPKLLRSHVYLRLCGFTSLEHCATLLLFYLVNLPMERSTRLISCGSLLKHENVTLRREGAQRWARRKAKLITPVGRDREGVKGKVWKASTSYVHSPVPH